MNTRSIYRSLARHAFFAWAGASLLCGTLAVSAAETEKTNPPTSTPPAATNTVAKPAPIEVPLSQFTIPSSPAEGRNPFFPDSTFGKVVAKPTDAGAKVSVTLDLKGISKVGAKWYALINNRTFEAGEDADITMPGGRKVHVLCVSIRADGATIEADGVRQELKLKVY